MAPDEQIVVLRDAAHRAMRYIQGLDERAVAVSPAALSALNVLHEPFPERPTSSASVLELLDSIGSPATTATTGGRYFGYVIGGALPVALASSWG